ncbi:hypothetical protein WR25_16008 [Diploscapter pachys]|uniref:Uncharacterized protein n=1 Tax=Diploscapter pachys TaxID=2018661 RepID=A0A2A2M3C5_9BILA|nr:hypothetical protein WR25_16008 [Diploscapter pachys]
MLLEKKMVVHKLTVQSHTFSPKEFPVRPLFANQTPVFAKNTQNFSPKVEEHKPSPQSQQKKKWTEQDEVAMKQCGGVPVDMIELVPYHHH